MPTTFAVPKDHVRLTKPGASRRNGYMETLRLIGPGFAGGCSIYSWQRGEDGWYVDNDAGVSLDEDETRALFVALTKAARGGR